MRAAILFFKMKKRKGEEERNKEIYPKKRPWLAPAEVSGKAALCKRAGPAEEHCRLRSRCTSRQ